MYKRLVVELISNFSGSLLSHVKGISVWTSSLNHGQFAIKYFMTVKDEGR